MLVSGGQRQRLVRAQRMQPAAGPCACTYPCMPGGKPANGYGAPCSGVFPRAVWSVYVRHIVYGVGASPAAEWSLVSVEVPARPCKPVSQCHLVC